MEDELLPSGSEQNDDARRGSSAPYNVLGRREGAITSGDRYQKAAAMVDQVNYAAFTLYAFNNIT